MPPGNLDVKWFSDHLTHDILPHWLQGATTESGLFVPDLDREWKRHGQPYGTIVSQGRLLYNLAVGYELTGDKAYAEAAARGASFLVGSMYDDEEDGWFFSVDADGKVLDDTKDAYGHAFVLFGLSHAARVLGGRVLEASVAIAHSLFASFLDAFGGMIPRLTRDWSTRTDDPLPINSQNPMMHWFEALMELDEAAGRPAQELIVNRLFVQTGRSIGQGLPELYSDAWVPLPNWPPGRIDIGHQFEWAFLLSRAVQQGAPAGWLQWAEALLEFGMRVGYDETEGGIYADASLKGEVINPSKGWWQQAEAARAMLHHAVERGRDDLWEPFEKTMAHINKHLIDPEHGGWYAGRDQSKGSVWKVDYHVVAMCQEAMRLGALS